MLCIESSTLESTYETVWLTTTIVVVVGIMAVCVVVVAITVVVVVLRKRRITSGIILSVCRISIFNADNKLDTVKRQEFVFTDVRCRQSFITWMVTK